MTTPSFDQLVKAVQESAPGAGPLDRLSAAAAISATMADSADALLDHFVELCRSADCSWSEIGAALGVTRQAAQKRFVAGSLERFTPRARQVAEAAGVIARDQGADDVRLEHLLLALYSQPATIGARVLDDLGLSEADVRAAIAQRTARPGAGLADSPPLAQDLIGASLDLGHNYVGTEHMLLACYRRPSSVAAEVLTGLGATEVLVRERVIAALAQVAGT